MAWLDLVDEKDLKDIPGPKSPISDNGVAVVCRSGNLVFKRSIPFLIENELWCLKKMHDTGFVPAVTRWDKYTLLMEHIGKTPITDKETFCSYREKLLDALEDKGIRHGDITEYAIIPRDNKPYIIDFAESRLEDDPRPDKREGGDEYWINRTFEKICNG